MDITQRIALLGAMAFFLVGLLSGLWKYAAIRRSADGTAPPYVDICHRSALLYSFACVLLERMAGLSALPTVWELPALLSLLFFFAFAVLSYALHGYLRDTDNQLRHPHRLGRRQLSPALVHGSMVALVIGEIGGFVILAAGVILAL